MKYLILAGVAAAILGSAACTANPPTPHEITVSNTESSQEFFDEWERNLTSSPKPMPVPDDWTDLVIGPGAQGPAVAVNPDAPLIGPGAQWPK